jgi:hypothetical protein
MVNPCMEHLSQAIRSNFKGDYSDWLSGIGTTQRYQGEIDGVSKCSAGINASPVLFEGDRHACEATDAAAAEWKRKVELYRETFYAR